ncbi:unnamed protein product [Anisakis simplex]|uniref:CX domain-containing protein n=1 Tax=Anisakis simplex TaxID=6269 RepID=A0A0M3JTP1_ANISI|nr:unnamed protein product [Anisakis simplex]
MLRSLMLAVVMLQHSNLALEQICSARYPHWQTNLLLEHIVRRYAHEETFVDYSTGQHSARKVISEANVLMIDNRQLYLQPTFAKGECTYRFESKHLFRIPIYIHVSPNEEAYPFNRLHFKCPPDTVCCGLFCCPQVTRIIQEKFIAISSPPTDSSDFRRISDDSLLVHDEIIYSLRKLHQTRVIERISCIYYLGDEDPLRRIARLTTEQPVSVQILLQLFVTDNPLLYFAQVLSLIIKATATF